MARGLIGATGFVGSTLDRQAPFEARFNSKNFHDMAGRHFELLVCAGVSAAKWRANQDPESDRRAIEALCAVLAEVRCDRFVLISTIDVYPDPASGEDETAVLTGRDNHAYGRNRLVLEGWVRARFANAHTVRLPALFGPGLKKNALYDLLHDNRIAAINPAGVFQWYPTRRLWTDIAAAIAADVPLVNLFTEPLPMAAVIDRLFPGAPVGPAREPAPTYRLTTRYAEAFGGRAGFIMDAAACLAAMANFVGEARAAA